MEKFKILEFSKNLYKKELKIQGGGGESKIW